MAQPTRARHPQVIINKRRDSFNPDYAKSCQKHWVPDLSTIPERQALARLKNEWEAQPKTDAPIEYEGYKTDREFLTIELNDYEIYASPKEKTAGELTSLESLDVRGKQLWVDGVLSVGSVKCHVQNIQIKSYSISGYGLEEGPETEIYVQSHDVSHDNGFDIWYRLQRPGLRYKRFDAIFRWVTTLGKHVIDYLEAQPQDVSIGLKSFQKNFYDWILLQYPGNVTVRRWFTAHAGTDFRKAIHAHIDYLSQEAYNLWNRDLLVKHELWADCMRDDHKAIIPQKLVQSKTIATPHTYACFKNRYFASKLLEMQPSRAVASAQEARKRLLGFPAGAPYGTLPPVSKTTNRKRFEKIQVGEVVSFTPNDEEQRIWKEKSDMEGPKEWFAYVRDTKTMKDGTQRLYLIWMYRPQDTTISSMDYPVHNELFMSDHCNCKDVAVFSSEVTGRCDVEWFATSFNCNKDYIVRQKYLTENSSFVSLAKTDFHCDCDINSGRGDSDVAYQLGDTVYVTYPNAKLLEPMVVCGINQERIRARRLLRYKDCAGYAGYVDRTPSIDNELVWTDQYAKVPLKCVGRRCNVRYFSESEIKQRKLNFPYDRNGAGDYWVLSTYMVMSEDVSHIKYLPAPPASLRQASEVDDRAFKKKLSGLSLFSGLGNLDKGLEQSRAVEFKAAVDMCSEAIHTLHANAENPTKLKLWLGSVDDCLATLLAGQDHDAVLRIGKIDVISAGSPCPGFSTLQINWLSDKSLQNASHVTTICSFVDIYRPKWAFLENVVNMASTRKEYEGELVLSQLIACLVSMGYQVQQFIMNSWNYGSCQQRSRLILSIAAPGLPPIIPPAYTHSNPDKFRARTVGELRNGQKFGAQRECLTPFPYVPAEQALGHLPDIGNGLTYGCVSYPEHRLYCPLNSTDRTIIQHVPMDPPGLDLKTTLQFKYIPPELLQERKELGKAYRRIRGKGLVPTIVTQPQPSDSRSNGVVHWAQNRPITIEEARQTQGIPSCEVIIGSLAAQMRMIGNAVDRHISEPLGLALRCAYEKSLRLAPQTTSLQTSYEANPSDVVFDSDSGETFFEVPMPWFKNEAAETGLTVQSFTAHESAGTSTSGSGLSETDTVYLARKKPFFATSSTTSEEIARAWMATLARPSATSESLLPVRGKRAHNEDHTDTTGLGQNRTDSNAAKRMRGDDTEDKSTILESKPWFKTPTVEKQKPLVFKDYTFSMPASAVWSSSSRESSSRKTRHSGLEVEFKPKSWHKMPESEFRKAARERERRDSPPYA